jgi:uncharacterized UBP type Zn finger protein
MMGFPQDLSKKALIEVKNSGVDAAVEVVFQLQADTQVKEKDAVPDKKKGTIVEWNCKACTVLN